MKTKGCEFQKIHKYFEVYGIEKEICLITRFGIMP